MERSFFITGTDTDVGKTLVSSWLLLHLESYSYWKPIQCGSLEFSDTDFVKQITKLPEKSFLKPIYEFKAPLSPHEASRLESVNIEINKFKLPQKKKLVVEGAGGLLVPINEEFFVIDIIKKLKIPVILVCRSCLGTINHSLLSIECLKKRKIDIAGVILSGEKNKKNKEAIQNYGEVNILAELDNINPINRSKLVATSPYFLEKNN